MERGREGVKGQGAQGAVRRGQILNILKAERKRSFDRPGGKYETKSGGVEKINCASALVVNIFSSLTRMKNIR